MPFPYRGYFEFVRRLGCDPRPYLVDLIDKPLFTGDLLTGLRFYLIIHNLPEIYYLYISLIKLKRDWLLIN